MSTFIVNRFRILAFYSLLGVAGISGGASEVSAESKPKSPQVLSLSEVLASSQRHHPAVHAKTSDARAKIFKQLAAIGEFDAKWKTDASGLPSGYYEGRYVDSYVVKPFEGTGVEAYSGFRVGRGDFKTSDSFRETTEEGEVRAGILIPLLRGREIDDRRANIDLATQDRNQGEWSLESTRLKLQLGATEAYFYWIAAVERVNVLRGLLTVAEARQQQLEGQVSAGDKPRFDLIDNKRALLKRESDLVKARADEIKASQKLSFYLRNVDGDPVIPLLSRVPPRLPQPKAKEFAKVEIDKLVKEARSKRPEFRILESQKQQTETMVQVAENDWLPQLNLDLQAAKDLGEGDKKLKETELKVGFKVEVPLQYRKPIGKRRAAEFERESLISQMELLESELRIDLQQHLASLEGARERVVLAHQEVQAARELEDGEHIRFDQGDSSLIIVNIREQTAAEASVNLIGTLLDYQLAVAQLRVTLGRLETF